MKNEKGSILLESTLAILPLLLLAIYGLQFGLGFLKTRLQEYDLAQKGNYRLSTSSSDIHIYAQQYSLYLRH